MAIPLALIGAAVAGGGALAQGLFSYFSEKERARQLKRMIEQEQRRRQEAFARGAERIRGALEGMESEFRRREAGLRGMFKEREAGLRRTLSAGEERLRRGGEEFYLLSERLGRELISETERRGAELREIGRRESEALIRGLGEDIEKARAGVEAAYSSAIATARELAGQEVMRQLDILGVGAMGGARALIASRMMQEATLPLLQEQARAKTSLESQALSLMAGARERGMETILGIERELFGASLGALERAQEMQLGAKERQLAIEEDLLQTALGAERFLMETGLGLEEALMRGALDLGRARVGAEQFLTELEISLAPPGYVVEPSGWEIAGAIAGALKQAGMGVAMGPAGGMKIG